MPRKVSLQDIADSLGISRGTVDRAIHGRGRINEETRERVIREARRMGYIDRKINSFLPLQNPAKILALIPGNDPFFTKIETGLKKVFEELDSGPELILMNIPHEQPEKQIECMKEFLSSRKDPSGVIIVPSQEEVLSKYIAAVEKAGIRVVALNTDAPESGRTMFIGQDLYASGRTAGELMLKMNSGKTIILSGYNNIWAHSERVRGFQDVYREYGRLSDIIGPYFTHDDLAETAAILKGLPDSFDGVFSVSGLTTEGTGSRLLRMREQKAPLPVAIGFDCTDENIELLKSGAITCLISQSPQLQGYLAARRLIQLLKEDSDQIVDEVRIPIDIYFRENINFYRNHLEHF